MSTAPDADRSPSGSLPPYRGLDLLLPDHHRRLAAKCRELLAWAHTDDTRELMAAWCELEAELRDHIAAEEEVILPAYAEHAPRDAQRIRDDHGRMRELLTAMGVEIELHEARVARLRCLAEALDAHALSEEVTMYRWAQANLATVARHLLYVRIGRWFRGAPGPASHF
jgi:hypothetical protein